MPGKNPRGGNGPDLLWGLKDIEKLIDLLIERQVEEFEMETDGLRVRIKRGGAPAESPASARASSRTVSAASASVPAPASHRTSPPLAPDKQKQVEPSEAAVAGAGGASEPAEALHIIKSPIVGTFFSAPTPNAPPFVKVGDMVEVGRVLCIIEAMKLMNEIESEVAGEIVRIYVENGQPVEYGQPLFAVKPSQGK